MALLVPDEAMVIEAVRFPSGKYRLEGELVYAESGDPLSGAVLAGPHPLLGGTMSNNVVQGLADGLARRSIATLRFNYRGTGASDGPRAEVEANLVEFLMTSHVPEEPAYGEDVLAASTFLREVLGNCPALVGYSFGCSLLPAAAAPNVPLVLIAPTLDTHDYAAFSAVKNPLLVVASEDDFAANASRVRRWYEQLCCPRRLLLGRFDNHFFRGHEQELAEIVFDFLEPHLKECRCC